MGGKRRESIEPSGDQKRKTDPECALQITKKRRLVNSATDCASSDGRKVTEEDAKTSEERRKALEIEVKEGAQATWLRRDGIDSRAQNEEGGPDGNLKEKGQRAAEASYAEKLREAAGKRETEQAVNDGAECDPAGHSQITVVKVRSLVLRCGVLVRIILKFFAHFEMLVLRRSGMLLRWK